MHNTGQDITHSECKYIHIWLKNTYGKASTCDHCGNRSAKRYEWALKKGYIYDFQRVNFMQLCVSCHRKYDDSKENRLNRSAAQKGRIQSVETKAKISVAKKGKRNTVEARANMSTAAKNRSTDHKAKLSAGRKGKQHTVAAKAMISVALKAYWKRWHENKII